MERGSKGAAGDGAERTNGHCPHCRAQIARDVEWPWPDAGFLCPACRRGVGRGRGLVEPDSPDPAPLAEPSAAEPPPPPPPPPRQAGYPFGAYARLWLSQIKNDVGESTYVRYRGAVENHLIPAFEDDLLHEITPSLINEYKRAKAEGDEEIPVLGKAHRKLGPRTIRDHLAVLHRLFEAARSQGNLMGPNPVAEVEKPKAPPPVAEEPAPALPEFADSSPGEHQDARPQRAFSACVAAARRATRLRGTRDPKPVKRKRKRTWMGAALPVRAVAIMCVAAGALVVVDATITLFWQEPITALLASNAQAGVDRQFDLMVARVARTSVTSGRASVRRLARAAATLNEQTPNGHALGKIRIPRIGIAFTIVQGDDEASLEKGPGHYPETPLPGAAGHWTVGIAGHRTTYLAPFRHVDSLRPGDRIFVRMPYGRFTYVVSRTVIVDPSDPTILKRVGYDRLALTACNPPFSAAQRIIVYAREQSAQAN